MSKFQGKLLRGVITLKVASRSQLARWATTVFIQPTLSSASVDPGDRHLIHVKGTRLFTAPLLSPKIQLRFGTGCSRRFGLVDVLAPNEDEEEEEVWTLRLPALFDDLGPAVAIGERGRHVKLSLSLNGALYGQSEVRLERANVAAAAPTPPVAPTPSVNPPVPTNPTHCRFRHSP